MLITLTNLMLKYILNFFIQIAIDFVCHKQCLGILFLILLTEIKLLQFDIIFIGTYLYRIFTIQYN